MIDTGTRFLFRKLGWMLADAIFCMIGLGVLVHIPFACREVMVGILFLTSVPALAGLWNMLTVLAWFTKDAFC